MTDEDLRNLLDEATPGPWHSEEKAGMKAIGQPASIGVWSEHKFNAALALDDDDIDPEDEAWLAGIWGSIDNEDRANARLIAAAPDLAAEVLRLRAALAFYSCKDGCNDCSENERDLIGCGWTARAALAAIADEAKP